MANYERVAPDPEPGFRLAWCVESLEDVIRELTYVVDVLKREMEEQKRDIEQRKRRLEILDAVESARQFYSAECEETEAK